MAIYFVANSTVTDEGKLEEYLGNVGPTLDGHDVKILAHTNEAQVIEGQPAGARLVILEFPDEAAFRAWYDSPAYQAVIGLRFAATTGFAVLVDAAG